MKKEILKIGEKLAEITKDNNQLQFICIFSLVNFDVKILSEVIPMAYGNREFLVQQLEAMLEVLKSDDSETINIGYLGDKDGTNI